MQNEQILLEYFQKAINLEADREREEILSEAKEIEANALEKIRNESSRDAKIQMDKEINEIILENKKEISTMQRKINLDLIAKREELQNKVFEEAKQQLLAFTNDAKYQAWVEKQIQSLDLDLYEGGLEIRITSKDEALFATLKSSFNGEVQIVVDNALEIGGFVATNRAKGLIVDCSLDDRLESCKEWFYNHSGLVIQ